ncbi:MAG: FG-GAP repeat protein, partial [Phycisphaerales bacterium]|nr:FG-GAP repeat protein [Phycisphaerales bacterium]
MKSAYLPKYHVSVFISASGLALGAAWAQAQSEPFPAVFELRDLDGSNGFRMGSTIPSNGFGRVVGSAGDFNVDGLADIIISAPFIQPPGVPGGAYVVFGRSEFPATVEADGLTGIDGLFIQGVTISAYTGERVGGGDFNGDGVGDVCDSDIDGDGVPNDDDN